MLKIKLPLISNGITTGGINKRCFLHSRNAFRLSSKPDPSKILYDYIGPPDKESNLRPMVRAMSENETPLEQLCRKRRYEIENWNQEFWTQHNKRFYTEKEEFVLAYTRAGINEIQPDQMSEFYKKFLDKNQKLHFYYNISWYLKNFELLIMSIQLKLQKLYKKFNN